MTSGSLGRKIDHNLDPVKLLAAACELVSAEGLAGLTLRPLALHLDVSVYSLSSRYGARDDIIAAIIVAARTEDGAYLAQWRTRLAALDRVSAAMAADIAAAILDDMAGKHRAMATLFLELLQASAWDLAIRAPFDLWLAERAGFWAELGAKAQMPQAIVAAGLLHGYMIDELAHSVALADWAAYGMLRKLGLNRLFGGFAPSADGAAEAALFRTLFDELEYKLSELSVVHGASITADWRGDVAQAAARLITARGVGAVTHRAVAAKSNVKATTLAYRFPTQEDLVVGGLEYIIARLLKRMSPEGDVTADHLLGADPEFDVGRATFAVALSAPRMARLKPCSADMRRQRGVNLRKVLASRAEPGVEFDALSSQAISISLVGLSMTLHGEPDHHAAQLAQALSIAEDRGRSAMRAPTT